MKKGAGVETAAPFKFWVSVRLQRSFSSTAEVLPRWFSSSYSTF